jgi:hypothetical protein
MMDHQDHVYLLEKGIPEPGGRPQSFSGRDLFGRQPYTGYSRIGRWR